MLFPSKLIDKLLLLWNSQIHQNYEMVVLVHVVKQGRH